MNWIVVVSLIGAAQGFFIAYLVLAHARQRRANLWLGLYVLAYSALCLDDATNNSVLVLRYPDLAALFAFCILLLGPFLYQYVRTLTRRKPLGKLFLLHLTPALVMFLIFSVFHFLPMQQKRDLVSSAKAMEGHPSLDPTLAVAALQTLAYLTASVLMLRTYTRELKQSYSSYPARDKLHPCRPRPGLRGFRRVLVLRRKRETFCGRHYRLNIEF